MNKNLFLVSAPQRPVRAPATWRAPVASHESKPKFNLDLTPTEVSPMTWLLSLHLLWQPAPPKSSPKTHLVKNPIFHVPGKTSREGQPLKEEESCVHFQDYDCFLHNVFLDYISHLKSNLTLDISQIVYLC